LIFSNCSIELHLKLKPVAAVKGSARRLKRQRIFDLIKKQDEIQKIDFPNVNI